MGLKLEKLKLPSLDVIDAMVPGELRTLTKEWRERIEIYESLLFKARRRQYGQKSERSEKLGSSGEKTPKAPRGETTKKPSERYPEARVVVEDIDFSAPVPCPSCGVAVQDSGMTESSEFLDVKPKDLPTTIF